MASTPEGLIKKAVKGILAGANQLYYNMPVPTGYGESMLDFVICHRGQFAMVETKAPGGRLTSRQELCCDRIREAGGIVFVIDGPKGLQELNTWLKRPS